MKKIKSFFVFSAAFLAVALFFEFFLSFCGILMPIVKIDPEKGERYRPNLTCSSLFVCEGFGLSTTNAAGWFGKDFKDTGTDNISVAVIGNSFVANRQVFERSNFLSLTEKNINTSQALPGKSVSLFNFGKEDLPLKELLYVKEDVENTYHPDYYIVLLNNGSLISETHRYVAYYELRNGIFKIDTSFQKTSFVKNYHKFEWLTKSSVLFLLHRVQIHLPDIWEIFFDKFYCYKKTEEEHEIILEPEMDASAEINFVDTEIIKKLSLDKKVIFMSYLSPSLNVKLKELIGDSHFINIEEPVATYRKRTGIDPNHWEIPNINGHWNFIGHRIVANTISKNLVTFIKEDETGLNKKDSVVNKK